MSDRQTSSRERFLKGATAWMNMEVPDWQRYWLEAPCCLLQYANDVRCGFDPETRGMLADLEQCNHKGAAQQLYGRFVVGDRLSSRDAEKVYCQAAELMEGMIHGIYAAIALNESEFRRDLDRLSDEFVQRAVKCCIAYQKAWPFRVDRQVRSREVSYGLAAFAPNMNLVAKAFQALARSVPSLEVSTSTWLAVQRLIDYVLGAPERPASEVVKPVEASMLLYVGHVRSPEEDGGEGVIRRLHVYRQVEGDFGFFVDSVAMGLTLMDQSMINSLDLAWRACQREIIKQMTDRTEPLPTLRVVPHLSTDAGGIRGVWQLSGGSAGALFACALYAAAMHDGLNTDTTASLAISVPKDASYEDLDISRILLRPISEESLRPKLSRREETRTTAGRA